MRRREGRGFRFFPDYLLNFSSTSNSTPMVAGDTPLAFGYNSHGWFSPAQEKLLA